MTDPPARQVEDENLAAATTTNEANVEPSPTEEEDNEATDPVTSVPESAGGPQFDYHVLIVVTMGLASGTEANPKIAKVPRSCISTWLLQYQWLQGRQHILR